MEATQGERALARRWLEAHLPGPKGTLPFSFAVDGRPALETKWTVERAVRELDAGRVEYTFTYRDSGSGLEARWVATELAPFPAVETVLHLRNNGAAESPLIAGIQALDTSLTCLQGRCILHYSRGARTRVDDFEPLRRVLGTPSSAIHFEAGGGRSSSEHLPFFNVETEGQGTVVGIGWTGQWAARLTREGERVRVQAGMELTRLRLHPGEEIRSPLVLLLFWKDDPLRGQNLLRRLILKHHSPHVKGAPLSVPVLCPSWGSTPFAVHEQNVRTIVSKDLPVDYYWIDAEWFGASPWWQNTGNWEVRKDVYPRGLKPLSDLLHASGRKLMVWFEPHRVSRGTRWHREHPEWLLSVKPGQECWSWPHWVDMDDPLWAVKESNRNQIAEGDALLDIGIPAARAFLTEAISKLIEECGIDCYREDFNISPLSFWRAADAPDRQGMTEIRWVEGLYAFWDELRARHPGLIIDNCASGGRRIDLESLGRATPFWRTDYPSDSLAMQCQTRGLLPWVPLNSVGRAPIGMDDPYRFRSAMCSSLLAFFDERGDGPNPEAIPGSFPFDVARRNLESYRALQPFFYGDFYPLTDYSLSGGVWMAWQLDRPDLGEGLVFVFRRPLSPFTHASFRLLGLDDGARYEVSDLDTAEQGEVTGDILKSGGLNVVLEETPGSALLRYRRLGSG